MANRKPTPVCETETARRARGAATVVSVRLTPAARENLERVADRMGVTRNALIETIAVGLDTELGVLMVRS